MNEQKTVWKEETFSIVPCEDTHYISGQNGFRKLKTTSGQKMQVSALAGQMPNLMAADVLSDVYICRFPDGIEGTLTQLRQGGLGGMIRGEDGKFVGAASFYKAADEISLNMLQAFNVMSIASGQYFLSQINSKLDQIKKGMDDILAFLYGDKKAELLSEISFTKHAYENYISMAAHRDQRIATIASLQQARKVAMKDVEFYIGDLEAVTESKDKIAELLDKAYRTKGCLDLSIQLYVMAAMLETYYAKNHDVDYISYLEADITAYINKCDKQELKLFGKLEDRVRNYKPLPLDGFNKQKWANEIHEAITSLECGEEPALKKSIHDTLYSATKDTTLCFCGKGDVYLKTA